MGVDSNSERNGDVVLQGQIVQFVDDTFYSGRTRWAKIKY
jgi:hypothetical protein